MERHKFETLADFKGKSLEFCTTHADLVRRQAERKAAQRAAAQPQAAPGDNEWHGDKFVQQSNALARG